MHLLFDNLTANIIGGTLILVMIAINIGIQKMGIERAVVHTAKEGLLSMAEIIEQDMYLMGQDLKSGEEPIISQTNTSIELQYRKNPADVSPTVIKYERVFADSIITEQDTLLVYKLVRKENGVDSGESLPYLTFVNFRLLDDNNNIVGSSDAKKVRVRLGMALPFRFTDGTVRELYWGSTFRPIVLQ